MMVPALPLQQRCSPSVSLARRRRLFSGDLPTWRRTVFSCFTPCPIAIEQLLSLSNLLCNKTAG